MSASKIPISFEYAHWSPEVSVELSEVMSFIEIEGCSQMYPELRAKQEKLFSSLLPLSAGNGTQQWCSITTENQEEIITTLIELLETPVEEKRHFALLFLQYLLLGSYPSDVNYHMRILMFLIGFDDSKGSSSSAKTENLLQIGKLLLPDFFTLVQALKYSYRLVILSYRV